MNFYQASNISPLNWIAFVKSPHSIWFILTGWYCVPHTECNRKTNKLHSKSNWPSEPMRLQISTDCPELSPWTHLCNSLSGCRSQTYLFVCLFLAGNKTQMRDGACNSPQHCLQRNSSKWWIYLGKAVYLGAVCAHTHCNKHVHYTVYVFVFLRECQCVLQPLQRENAIIFPPQEASIALFLRLQAIGSLKTWVSLT